MIAFNKAHLTGNELAYIGEALHRQTSGNGLFTKRCQDLISSRYHFKKTLLTTSCTDALEMAALLLDIKPGDEIIIPSFTFVSTANPFIMRGAKIVFADSCQDHPNLDVNDLQRYITPRTKAVVAVHYAGVAIEMTALMDLARRHNLFVVEDAAQSIESFYYNKPLGGIGHLGCFSFHETKNISCGEGGAIIINDDCFLERAEILWEKGTNRSAFIRGEVDKYGWVDIGSSFLPSEIIAAFLFAQLENIEAIQDRRMKVWNYYRDKFLNFLPNFGVSLPLIPTFAVHNSHTFYLRCRSLEQRNYLIARLKQVGIQAFFHYLPLHHSRFFLQTNTPRALPNAIQFSEQILRLPMHVELTVESQDYIVNQVKLALETCD